jgi:methylglutaconyl-CoA hydratase
MNDPSVQHSTIRWSCDNRVARIVLANPDWLNVLNGATVDALRAAIDASVAAHAAIVLLGAEGRAFTAGADLKEPEWMSEAPGNLTQRFLTLLDLFANGPFVSVALIDGLTLGGGVGFAAACDFAFATERARFSMPEVKRGLIPAILSPFVLSALGRRRALRMMMLAEELSARDAERLGLVTDLYPDATAMAEASEALITRVSANAPGAVAELKTLVEAQSPILTDQVRDLVTSAITARRNTAEFREGIRAFREKRQPIWP